jgi:hypothetical protein
MSEARYNDQWSKNFETFVTITVGTDMMGHVRVQGTNDMTDDDPVVVEIEVGADDPHETDVQVAEVIRDVYMRTSLT